MPGKHNTLLLFFSDFGRRFLDLLLRFLYRGARNLFLRHYGHVQAKTDVGLLKLCPTSLSCHSS